METNPCPIPGHRYWPACLSTGVTVGVDTIQETGLRPDAG